MWWNLCNTTSGEGPGSSYATGELVGWWRLDGDPNNVTNAIDSSGYGNNGTIIGATFTKDGKIRGAYDFDGSVGTEVRIDNTSELYLTSKFTISLWTKVRTKGNYKRFIGKENASDGNYRLLMDDSADQKVWFSIRKNSVSFNAISNDALPINVWTMLTGIYNGTGLRLYVDGVPQTTTVAFTESFNLDFNDVLFGTTFDGGSRLDGTLDEVMIFNKALSATEIWKLYTGSKLALYSGGNLTLNSGGSLTFYS